MEYELYIEGDNKVLDIFISQLCNLGLNTYAHNFSYLWISELRDSLADAILHNSNLVLPVPFFLDEDCNCYLRLEHEYVILPTSSTYMSNLRLCKKVENGVFGEIVLYGVYCKPVK